MSRWATFCRLLFILAPATAGRANYWFSGLAKGAASLRAGCGPGKGSGRAAPIYLGLMTAGSGRSAHGPNPAPEASGEPHPGCTD